MSIEPCPCRPDQVVTYTVLVRNRGNVPLTGVAVTDPNAPDCARTLGGLSVGAYAYFSVVVYSYYCS